MQMRLHAAGALDDDDLATGMREIRDRLWAQGEPHLPPVAGLDRQNVVNKIEIHLEYPLTIWNRRSRESPRGKVKHYMPGMVEPWRECNPDLPDDLRIELQCCASIAPRPIGQVRPCFRI